MREIWHGTPGGYSNHKCRCDECRLAWNQYCIERRKRRKLEFQAGEIEVTHGTSTAYAYGCRCFVCVEAKYSARRQLLYVISNTDYESMYHKQDGRCGICKKSTRLSIDHDHKTGRVRGLLCTSCNTAIGKLGDSIEGIQAAMDYLTTDI